MRAKTKKKILHDLDRLIDTLDGLHGTLKERSMLDPDAPDAIAVATDQKEVKWLHNRLKK